MTSSQLQRIMLELIAKRGTDRRLGKGRHYLAEAVRKACPPDDQPNQSQIQEAIWGLVGRGLTYLDISQPAPENWSLSPTRDGQALLSDEEYNPDDPSGYLSRLYEKVPGISPLARQYINEAVQAYYHRAYLAANVMLGVAAEAMVLDVGNSIAEWLSNRSGENLKAALANGRKTYIQKFNEFRKRLLSSAPELPPELANGLDLQISAVLDLLRVNRNESGHPTGAAGDRDDTFVSLRVFARVAKRLYALKVYLEQ